MKDLFLVLSTHSFPFLTKLDLRISSSLFVMDRKQSFGSSAGWICDAVDLQYLPFSHSFPLQWYIRFSSFLTRLGNWIEETELYTLFQTSHLLLFDSIQSLDLSSNFPSIFSFLLDCSMHDDCLCLVFYFLLSNTFSSLQHINLSSITLSSLLLILQTISLLSIPILSFDVFVTN